MAVVDPTSLVEPPVSGQSSRLILVSGPARSGKSRWAEHLLHHHPVVTYIATAAARPDDRDWQKRLEAHRQRRPDTGASLNQKVSLSRQSMLSLQGNPF